MVLRLAFDEDRRRVPKMVIKVRDASVSLIPTLALRTLGGGPSDKISSARADDLAQLIEDSACRNATEFNLRLAASEPVIKTTIGGTASLVHLEDYLKAAANPAPLPGEILQRLEQMRIQ